LTAGEKSTVKVTRVFDFPRKSVFRMWTDPRKLGEWWGPEGSVTILSEVDLKPGGAIRVDRRNSDGIIYSFNATLEKVILPQLLVYRHMSPSVAGFSPWEALHTVTFEELSRGRTQVTTVTKIVEGPQKERKSLKEAYRVGWGESFDKLHRALR
jgi:uncharacterized protein YndB with AHSA1/START domain